ncbi:hypothetical protein DY000_02059060 [Brassica cretica]|uniref:Uncharacterized protein n=1 Tax=Brassica cretica TaxID=69181 RepID=A0ABQ7AV63_BRACR|nr:hypothetical protein DY000_02059060 [Brassica cretica]
MENERLITCKDALKSSSPSSFLPSFLNDASQLNSISLSLSFLLTAHLLHPTRSPIFTNLRFSSIFSPIHHRPPLSPLGSRLPPPRSCLLSIALFVSHWLCRRALGSQAAMGVRVPNHSASTGLQLLDWSQECLMFCQRTCYCAAKLVGYTELAI